MRKLTACVTLASLAGPLAPSATASPGQPDPAPLAPVNEARIDELAGMSLEALLDTSVTVASKTAVEATQAPSIVSVIPRATIAAMGYRSVAEALRSVPGFYVIDDYLTSNVAIRGVHGGPDSWSRVLKVLVNGQPATVPTTGGNLLGPEFIPIDSVESIEVIRGAGSALYGANAFLGVVNVITRRPQPGGALLETAGEIGLAHGHPAYTGHVMATVMDKDGKSYLAFSASGERVDRSGAAVPDSSPSAAQYAGQRSEDDLARPTSLFGDAVLDLGKLGTLRAQYLDQRLDAHGEFSTLSVLSHRNHVAVTNQVLALDHNLALPWEATQLHSYGSYAHVRDQPSERLDTADPSFQYRRDRLGTALTLGSEASVSYGAHSLLVGTEFQQLLDQGDTVYQVIRSGSSAGDQWLRDHGTPDTTRNYAAFAQLIVKPLKDLTVTAGLRRDWNHRRGNSLNPRVAVVYAVTKELSAKAVVATSYVPPAPTQLRSSSLRFEGGILGNLDLQSQRAATAEVELSYRQGARYNVSVNGFYTNIDDKVEFVPTGNLLIARNLTTSHSLGAEAVLRTSLPPFTSALSASFQHTTATAPSPEPFWWRQLYSSSGAGGERSLYAPAWQARWELGASFPEYHVQASSAVSYAGMRKSSADNIRQNGMAYELPRYVLIDATVRTVGLQALPGRTTTLSLHVNNLLDQRYAEAGQLGVDLPGSPRSIFFRLEQAF